MKGKRRLHHESLENRRLLAASCEPVTAPHAEAPSESLPLQVQSIAESERIRADELHPWHIGIPSNIWHTLSHGPDLIHEEAGRVFVVDQHPFAFQGGQLHVFQRAEDGTLATVAEVETGFPVERMIVSGQRVLLFGNSLNRIILPAVANGAVRVDADPADGLWRPEDPKTTVVTVTLGDQAEVVRQELDGSYRAIHDQGDQIVIVSSVADDAHIAIYPPPPQQGLATTYDITDEGLAEVASQAIPLPAMTRVAGRDFYAASVSHPDVVYFAPEADPATGQLGTADHQGDGIRPPDEPMPPVVSVTRYVLGDDAINELDTEEIGPGFLMHFEVSPDGETAVAVRSEFSGAGPATLVDLLDLSGDQVKVFDSIRLPEFTGHVVAGGPEYVVLHSHRDDALVVIDANQDIDISAEGRVRRIPIPDNLRVHRESVQVSRDRLVLRAHRVTLPEGGDEPDSRDETAGGDVPGDVNDSDATGFAIPEREHTSILLTISMSQAAIIAESDLATGSRPVRFDELFLIDSETERLGFLVKTSAADHPQFLFGRLGDDGQFQRDGMIPVNHWLEIDANADRLIVRQDDQLLEFDWDNPEEPVVTPLGEPDPVIEAVNDEFTLYAGGEDHWLNVLANDVIHHHHVFSRAEIVELVDAPEGAEIDGHLIRIPSSALEGVDSLRFEYVISDGQHQSSAVVEIDVLAISEDEVRELVQTIRRQAAEDFGVSVEDVEVTFVERLFNEPLPVVLPGGGGELDLSPGILVTLKAPGASALYAASLDGEIIQVLASRQEVLAELGLQAVDDNGQILEQVAAGDQFWLELTAKDLRRFGLGVYAAFFDLIVPTEHLVVTGPIEYGDGFTSIRVGSFDEGEIDDLGAIGTEIEHPGSEKQELMRIAVRAVAAGEVTLQPRKADARGTETLLRGRQTELPSSRVRYQPLTLSIVEATEGNPLDADGNGEVTAADALVVINFLGRFGSMSVDQLPDAGAGMGGEGEDQNATSLAAMQRYDTNRNGMITALDALVIINDLGKQQLAQEIGEAEKEDDVALGQIAADVHHARLF